MINFIICMILLFGPIFLTIFYLTEYKKAYPNVDENEYIKQIAYSFVMSYKLSFIIFIFYILVLLAWHICV